MRSFKSYKGVKEEASRAEEGFGLWQTKDIIKFLPHDASVAQTQLKSLNKNVTKGLNSLGIKKSAKPLIIAAGYTGDFARAVAQAGKGNVVFTDINRAWVSRSKQGVKLDKRGRDAMARPIKGFQMDIERPQINDTVSAILSFEPTPMLSSLNKSVLPNLGAQNGFVLAVKTGGTFHTSSSLTSIDPALAKEYGVQVKRVAVGGKDGLTFYQFKIPEERKGKYLFDRECFEEIENKGESVEEVARRLHASRANVLTACNRYKMMRYKLIKLK
jgi:hypothetical protein